MSIVLNENDWVERVIAERTLGNKPAETLMRLSKYYYANHYNKREVRRLLESFMLQCDSRISLVDWSKALDNIVESSRSIPLVVIDGIEIFDSELEAINRVGSKLARRLAFTLLCLAKYWDIVNSTDGHWVNNRDNEIMRMANINTSIKRQSELFSILRECGLIQFAKKIDNLHVRVTFMDKGVPALEVRDFRNLGYQYLKYYGGDYIECINCGIITPSKTPLNSPGRPQKYCEECAAEIKLRQTVNSVMARKSTKSRTNLS